MTADPSGTFDDPIPRPAARVLLVDDAGRVLMFRGFDPARPTRKYWFTAGGGLAEGETPAQGAVRELGEETGLEITEAALGEPVWQQTANFPYDNRWYRQEQLFFLVRVPFWEVDIEGFDAEERRSIDAHRWWSIAELERADERFYPEELPALLREILNL